MEPLIWNILNSSREVSPQELRFMAMPTTMGSDLKCSTKVPKTADMTIPATMPNKSPMNAFSNR